MNESSKNETAVLNPVAEGSRPADRSREIKRAKVMIVDDEPVNIRIVRKYLEMEGYVNFVTTTRAGEACSLIEQERPEVILLDIMMPGVSGIDILKELRSAEGEVRTPVIVLTATTDPETKREALELGATDFLTKPVDVHDLVPRVGNALKVKMYEDNLRDQADRLEEEVRARTEELARTRLEVIHCLALAADYRDNETGHHVIRVGRYVGVIARELGLDEAMVELMEHAAPLHDVGKIGIPDAILLKPGKLSEEEFALMQTHSGLGKRVFECVTDDERVVVRQHPDIGAKIMGGTHSPLLLMAARIAITHHEKWNGSGYPLALSGTHIPLEGRITAVADVFDALSSKRPYKPAFPLEKCLSIMEEERGKHFDPKILDAFLARLDDIVAIQIKYADTE